MKTVIGTFVLATTTLALLILNAPCQDGKLNGRWSIVSVPEGWKKVPGTSVVISDGSVQICVAKIPASNLTYTLNRAQGTVEARRIVKGKTVVQRGVYRQSGDTLTLSVGAEGKPPPANPDASGDGAMHWVFKRTASST